MNYPINEHEHSINSVSGRMFTIRAPQEVRGNMVHRCQKWKSVGRPVKGYGTNGIMHVNIHFDDKCQNGHQTFSITADVYTAESRRQRDIAAGGCMHEEIEKIFPELAPLIKWHLVSTDGPMYYVANTVYYAGNRDHWGRAPGEPSEYKTVIYFGDSPVSHKVSDKLAAFIRERTGTGDFQVITIPYEGTVNYEFDPKYTFVGYGEKWHDCPFSEEERAQEFARALNTCSYRIERMVTARSEGKPRDLDAARSCAVWPEATDKELSADKETLTAALNARLPGLIAAFRADMERIGFLWEPEA